MKTPAFGIGKRVSGSECIPSNVRGNTLKRKRTDFFSQGSCHSPWDVSEPFSLQKTEPSQKHCRYGDKKESGIDFRTDDHLFSESIVTSMHYFYNAAYVPHENLADGEKLIWKKQIKDLYTAFYQFYHTRHIKLQKTYKSTYKTFCDFLQHLIYYVCHNARNEQGRNSLCEEILKELFAANFDFLGPLNDEKIYFWRDEKTEYTIVNSLCRVGDVKNIKLLFEKIAIGKNTNGFRRFINTPDHYGFSPLNTASKEGHHEVVKILLEAAIEAYGSKDREGFKKFINSQTELRFTPINNCAGAASRARSTNKSTEQYDSILTLLVEYGATINIVDKFNKTPLQNYSQFNWSGIGSSSENGRNRTLRF